MVNNSRDISVTNKFYNENNKDDEASDDIFKTDDYLFPVNISM